MEIHSHTNLQQLLSAVPETGEFLHPFVADINDATTVGSLAETEDVSLNALVLGLERAVKRAKQNPFDFETMRSQLIKPGAVNVAGFVNFLWQNEFVAELKSKAEELNIDLNINIFPKQFKAMFQNYLSVCKKPDHLPEILIGKGFSSLMSSRFVDTFVKSGDYTCKVDESKMSQLFVDAGLQSADKDYHPFGVDEMVMLLDKTVKSAAKVPTSWSDILSPEYKQLLAQMGKNQRDHFGFVIMLYLYAQHGTNGIEQYAANMKSKEHFTSIIKGIGKSNEKAAVINIVHQYAGKMIRSDAKDKTEIITTTDGNPTVCIFFLIKNTASREAMELVNHLYSPQIKAILEKGGTNHITSNSLLSGSNTIRWVGWDVLKSLQHPYIKEYLSEIAYSKFKNETI
jgi:hypothetical protein